MSAASTYQEKELLLRIAEGNTEAFETLYLHYRNKALSIILAYVKSYTDAEDILQDIFIQLWSGRKNLTDVDNFDAYLFISVRHAIGHAMRQRERQERLKARAPLQETVSMYNDRDLQQIVQKALAQLTPQQRKMYDMSRREGMTHEQIAAALQLSPKTVSNTITLILNHIRIFLVREGYVLSAAWAATNLLSIAVYR